MQAAAAHQARVRELTAQAAEARDAEAEARRALTQAAEQQRAEAASRLVSLQRAAEGASRAADSEVAALRGQLRDEQERRWGHRVCMTTHGLCCWDGRMVQSVMLTQGLMVFVVAPLVQTLPRVVR